MGAKFILALGFALLLAGGVPRAARAQNVHSNQHASVPPQTPLPPDSDVVVSTDSLKPGQKMSIMQLNFVKAKTDSAELAALAKELREALDKPQADRHSSELIGRAERIEKLAKRIREETRAF
jgi:Flp pilus assembly protein CpaB